MSALYDSAYASSIDFDMSSPNCSGGSFPSSLLDRSLATYHSTTPSTAPSKRSVFSKIKCLTTRSRSRSRSRVDMPSLQTTPSLMPPIPSGPHPKSLPSSRMYSQSFPTTDLGYIPHRPPASPPRSPSYSICSQSTMSTMSSMTTSSTATDPCSPSIPINLTFVAQQDAYRPWISYPEDPFSQYSVIQGEMIQGRTSVVSPPKIITGTRSRTCSSPSVTFSRHPSTLASSQPLQTSPRPSIADLPVPSSRRGSYYVPRPYTNTPTQIPYDAFASEDYTYYDSYFETDSAKDADLDLERLRKECDDIRQMRQRKLALIGEVTSDTRQTQNIRGGVREVVVDGEGSDGESAFVGNVTSLTPTASQVIPGDRKRHSVTNSTSISFLHEAESRHRSYSDVARSEGGMASRRPRVDAGNVLWDGGEEEARKRERRRMRTEALSSSLAPECSRSAISLVRQDVDQILQIEKQRSTLKTPKQHSTTLHLDFPLPPPLVLPISMCLGPLPPTTSRSYSPPADKTQHTRSPATKPLLERLCSKTEIQGDALARPIASDKGRPRHCKSSHATPLPRSSRHLTMPNVYSSAPVSLYSSSAISLSSISSCSTMQPNSSLNYHPNSVFRRLSASPVSRQSQLPPRFPPPSRPIPPVPSATVDVGSTSANERSAAIISSRTPIPLVSFSSSRLSTTCTSSTNTIIPSSVQFCRMREREEERELLQRGLMALSSVMPFATDEWEYEAVEDDAHNDIEQAPVEESKDEATDLEIVVGYYSARSSFSL
ncbi:hypothetical protein BDQ12DRAFT_712672 [Crucibulum laeve]|uniref:Uncharacterized protein n=1 Tax=Crucibulum laeve TaxID=68775 RepID=A0A5C3M0K2_9AGAR|nr:hypothetical protein BDQ12DRAFT_712672 [Crucibulum laeve]